MAGVRRNCEARDIETEFNIFVKELTWLLDASRHEVLLNRKEIN